MSFQTCFSSQQELVRLLGAVCYGTPRNIDNKSEFKVSPTLQIYALHKCWKQLKSEDESVSNAFKPGTNVNPFCRENVPLVLRDVSIPFFFRTHCDSLLPTHHLEQRIRCCPASLPSCPGRLVRSAIR